MRGFRDRRGADTATGRDWRGLVVLAAQTASLGEQRWSCVATRMQVSACVRAANRQRPEVPSPIGAAS